MRVIYQSRLVDINYKDFSCYGSVIFNFCRNCSTVRIRGASGADFMTATSADTCITRLSVASPPLDLTFFYAGLCLLVCLFFRVLISGHKKVSYINPWNITHLQQLLHCRPCASSVLLLFGYMNLPLKYSAQEEIPSCSGG